MKNLRAKSVKTLSCSSHKNEMYFPSTISHHVSQGVHIEQLRWQKKTKMTHKKPSYTRRLFRNLGTANG